MSTTASLGATRPFCIALLTLTPTIALPVIRSGIMPTFAEQQLLKFGWKPGQAVGLRDDAPTRALRPTAKTDDRGLGAHLPGAAPVFQWWDHVYNQTSAQLRAMPAAAATAPAPPPPPPACGPAAPAISVHAALAGPDCSRALTDAELFAACGGRLARKGARASQGGKAARLAAQEARERAALQADPGALLGAAAAASAAAVAGTARPELAALSTMTAAALAGVRVGVIRDETDEPDGAAAGAGAPPATRAAKREAKQAAKAAKAAARHARRAAKLARRQVKADRRQAKADRRQAKADRRQAKADRRQAKADRRQAKAARRAARAAQPPTGTTAAATTACS
ncbi:hypothetical protein CXG81DRAFT_27719 [Caulochytrium protostelioides]|uniref:G-patch domain-containing protein n=1 Tax=Caulochytrium protostelioides TaxID=1555241 RepID=A0A4P9X3C8_9FUNG|nr:hypothetical protein CXG81DRAFT_27719 [Caulochytrium protostelioides]|eukprot:RKO99537.1 hypothetical protein CXG81DRAFT_27719 [Caulochytrium protostelioides]